MARLEPGSVRGRKRHIVVTLSRKDFLKQYVKLDIHPGLVILLPEEPNVKRQHQIALFEKALEVFSTLNDDLVNKLIEILEDGSVHVRQWNSEEHDIGHIGQPGRR